VIGAGQEKAAEKNPKLFPDPTDKAFNSGSATRTGVERLTPE
jgi:hypothetical protein